MDSRRRILAALRAASPPAPGVPDLSGIGIRFEDPIAKLAETVVDELDGSDFARFSAVGVSPEEMKSCLERTRSLFVKLERFVPRPEAPE